MVEVDADFSHDHKYVPDSLRAVEGADLVHWVTPPPGTYREHPISGRWPLSRLP
jgi:hypothetical protein